MGDVAERFYGVITRDDLERLATIATRLLEDLFARRPEGSGVYRGRLLLLALCQGGAQHFVDGENGVKDLDVWAFFRAHPDRPFPFRSRWVADFGPSHLGRHPDDEGFKGRRIDLLGRSIEAQQNEDEVAAVRRWLARGRGSAWYLGQRPVVAVHPPNIAGQVIWPGTSAS